LKYINYAPPQKGVWGSDIIGTHNLNASIAWNRGAHFTMKITTLDNRELHKDDGVARVDGNDEIKQLDV
jgi:hypothetical protein